MSAWWLGVDTCQCGGEEWTHVSVVAKSGHVPVWWLGVEMSVMTWALIQLDTS